MESDVSNNVKQAGWTPGTPKPGVITATHWKAGPFA